MDNQLEKFLTDRLSEIESCTLIFCKNHPCLITVLVSRLGDLSSMEQVSIQLNETLIEKYLQLEDLIVHIS